MSKYDWSNVPDEVEWIATDSNGLVFGYDVEPIQKEWGKFIHHSDFIYFPHKNWIKPFKGDWRDSLEKRPEGKRLEVK